MIVNVLEFLHTLFMGGFKIIDHDKVLLMVMLKQFLDWVGRVLQS